MGKSSRTPKRNVEIRIEQEPDLDERYLRSPNCLHRGEKDAELGLDYTRMATAERLLLAALLSMRKRDTTDRAKIEEILWDLSRPAVDKTLLGLRLRGHLRVTRENGEGGLFVYRWRISRAGRKDWAEEERAEHAARQRRAIREVASDVLPGETMHRIQGHGLTSDDSDETTASPCPPSPGHGQPYPGHYAGGKEQTEEKKQPPLPHADQLGTGSTGVEADRGESPEDSENLKTARSVLDAVLGGVAAARRPRGRSLEDLAETLCAPLAEGWTTADLITVLGARRLTDAGSVAKCLHHRIATLGDPPPAPTPRTAPVVEDATAERLLAAGRLDRDEALRMARAAAAGRTMPAEAPSELAMSG